MARADHHFLSDRPAYGSLIRITEIDQKQNLFLDAEQEIEKLRFETLNLFDNYNRKCRAHELKTEKEKCYPQLHHNSE